MQLEACEPVFYVPVQSKTDGWVIYTVCAEDKVDAVSKTSKEWRGRYLRFTYPHDSEASARAFVTARNSAN